MPQVEFGELDRVTDAQKNHIRQRGCLVIRNVFDDARVAAWTEGLSEYLEANDYLEKLKKGGAVDEYFGTLASAKPQIYGVFWSRAQMEARTDPAMARAQAFLNGLWRFGAERSGFRSRSDSHLLGPRPIPPTRRCFAGTFGSCRCGVNRSLDRSGLPRHGVSPRVWRRFKSATRLSLGPYRDQGNSITGRVPHVPDVSRWTALTRQGPNDGTLQLLPMPTQCRGCCCARYRTTCRKMSCVAPPPVAPW